MNATNNHIAYVEANPHDKTAALALADHLQERFDLPRYYALRSVVKYRRDQLDAEHTASAARKCRRQSITKVVLFRVLRDALHLSWYSDVRVMVVRGFRKAELTTLDVMPEATRYLGHVVAIGAREYLRLYRETQNWIRSLSSEQRRMILKTI